MPQLDNIQISGFKSIKNAEIGLKPLNILIGANGAGKTNFISLFNMLNELIEKRLQRYVAKSGGADNLLFFGNKRTDEIRAFLNFGKNAYGFILQPTINNQLYFSSEYLSYHNPIFPNPWETNLGSGHVETLLLDESKRHSNVVVADHVIRSIKRWKLYHFHDTGENSRVKSNSDLNDNQVFKPDASNLAAFLYMLKEKHNEHYVKILKTVQLIAPFIHDFVLEPSKLNEETIRLEWKHVESDMYFDISQLSDGTIRTICLATLMLQPDRPSTILIDEPELGLHPYAINVMGALFKSVSKKTQIIASTQSLLFVDQFEPEDLIVTNNRNGQSDFNRYTTEELKDWLEEYTLGELWEKNVLGGRPR